MFNILVTVHSLAAGAGSEGSRELPAGAGQGRNDFGLSQYSGSALGLTYIQIPVVFQNPTDKDFAKFCAETARLKEVPVPGIQSNSVARRFFMLSAMYSARA